MMPNKAIRLFADAHVFDGEHQGSRTNIKELYTRLALNSSLQLFMAAYDIDNLKKEFSGCNNITFIKYTTKSSVWRLLVQIPALIKKYKIDYAHFQYIVPLYKNCRFIVTIHDALFNDYPQFFPSLYRWQKNLLYGLAAKRADILTTVSDYSKQTIMKHFGIGSSKITVIPHGISSHFFEAYDKATAKETVYNLYGFKNIILYVSRMEPRKNHALLLRAFTELELYKKDYHLVLAGHPSLPVTAFDDLYNTLPEAVKCKVNIQNNCDDARLLILYRAASCFIYPSAAEGFGIPPLEAAAVQIPVLCSNHTALADFNFFKPYHISVSDFNFFKETLGNLLQDENAIRNTATIRSHVQQNYCWKNAAALFNKLIADHYDKL